MKNAAVRKPFPWWHEVVLAVLLLVVLFIAWQMDYLSLRGELLLARRLWVIGILAMGMTLVILSGGIDLSVGAAMGLCAVTFGICFQRSGSPLLSSLVCLFTGAAGGLFNGLCVTRFRVHPLIVTLATYAAFRGMAEGISQGESYSRFGDSFAQLTDATWFGVPLPACIFLTLALAVGIFLKKSATGRFIYALGHNEVAARFSGVPVDQIKILLYSFSGLLAGLATVLYVSRFDTAKADAGRGFELEVITAVVVGGTSIFGGRGTIVGTLLGLALIHETRLFVGRYWRTEELKSIVVGCLLIVSVLVYRALTRKKQE